MFTRHRRAFTLPELLICLGILAVLFSLICPAILRVIGMADRLRCQNNLRQIGFALAQYSQSHSSYPSAIRLWDDRYPYLTWQARLLPYLDQRALWNSTESAFAQQRFFWRAPHIDVRSTVISTFICPAEGRRLGIFDDDQPPAAFTHYLGVSGDKHATYNGMLFPYSRVKPSDVSDGAAYTIIVGERPPSANGRFGWWYAGIGQDHWGTLDSHMSVRAVNQSFYAPMCPYGPYDFQRGSSDDTASMFHFWSAHPGGAHFLFVDSSARFLRYSANDVLPALATRAGSEVVGLID